MKLPQSETNINIPEITMHNEKVAATLTSAIFMIGIGKEIEFQGLAPKDYLFQIYQYYLDRLNKGE